MKAIKALYRDLDGDLHSAIPTLYALAYAEGKKTVPEIGRIMVFLDTGDAKRFCKRDASTWYRPSIGELEVWAVECRNLYKMIYMILPCDLAAYGGCGKPHLARFWQAVAEGGDPRDTVAWATQYGVPIWTTDWIIPQERLEVYSIRHSVWIRDCRRNWRMAE